LIKGNPKIDFVTPWFKKDSNFIILLGTIKGELGGSQYLKDIHGKVAGDAPNIDLEFESRVIRACLDGIRHRIINSAIDVSDGGLAVAIAKACISNPEIELGASIHISRKLKNEELLFGESQSMIIVTIDEDKLLEIETIASKNLVPCFTIGRVKDNGMMKFNDLINLPLADLKSAYNGK
jgi:phosphoribosylformylglycinamidine synthase